jgi:2-oxoglutarate ferredoxin oxidoreductase subunit delta
MRRITIDAEYCKGCNLCVHVCPRGALSKGVETRSKKGYLMPVGDPEKCVLCRMCEAICPDFSISVSEEAE